MEKKTFADNYIQSISSLRQLLVDNAVNPDRVDITVHVEERIFNSSEHHILYYVEEDEDPVCKIVYCDKGIFFYEKKDKDINT